MNIFINFYFINIFFFFIKNKMKNKKNIMRKCMKTLPPAYIFPGVA